MILTFPLPGYVAKLLQSVQQERMKKVNIALYRSQTLKLMTFRQTDARVQSVTEGKQIAIICHDGC